MPLTLFQLVGTLALWYYSKMWDKIASYKLANVFAFVVLVKLIHCSLKDLFLYVEIRKSCRTIIRRHFKLLQRSWLFAWLMTPCESLSIHTYLNGWKKFNFLPWGKFSTFLHCWFSTRIHSFNITRAKMYHNFWWIGLVINARGFRYLASHFGAKWNTHAQ